MPISKSERLRKAYESKLGKNLVSKLSDDQIKLISKYYNSLSDSEQSNIDSAIVQGKTNTDLHEMARGFIEEEEDSEQMPEGLDDLLNSIRAPKAKVTKITSSALVAVGGSGKKVDGKKFFGESKYQKYIDELTSSGTIDGEQLSPAERKEGFKKRGDKIAFEDFVKKILDRKESQFISQEKKKLSGAQIKSPLAIATPKVDDKKVIQKPEPEQVVSPASEETQENLDDILDKIDSILDTIKNEEKAKKKKDKEDSREREKKRRKKKEEKLESSIFKGLAKGVDKVLQPVKSIFKKIFDFFTAIFFARIVTKIFDWLGDRENQQKLKSLIRFLSDFWPVIAGAYLLFGTKFGKLIRTIGKWAVQIAKFAIPKLLRFISKNPRTAILLAGAGYLGARILTNKEAGGEDEDTSGEETSQSQTDQGESKQSDGTTPEPMEFSKGGSVPGSGNRDTIPAMLTPGEFVMSKGAVAKYGTNTLASMNSVGGGTNIPSFSDGLMGFQGGGSVPGGDEAKTKEQRGPMSWMGNLFGGGSKPPATPAAAKPKSGGLTDIQKRALAVLAKYESGAAGYNAVNQIGTSGGRGVKGFSGDIRKMSQHKGRSLTDFTIGEIKALQRENKSMSDSQWIKAGKLHAVGRYQFIGNTLPGVAKRAGIPDNAKFTAGVQDLMALQLMKERGISPWVGPSDKATNAERAIIAQARKQPIKFDPSMPTGSSVGADVDIASSSGSDADISSDGGVEEQKLVYDAASDSYIIQGGESSGQKVKTFDWAAMRTALGVSNEASDEKTKRIFESEYSSAPKLESVQSLNSKVESVSKSSKPSTLISPGQSQQMSYGGSSPGGPINPSQRVRTDIPYFDSMAMISPRKIKTLGIMI